MTIEGFVGLFSAMLIVAAVPGPAVFAISSASMAGGFRRGLHMTIGLLFADFAFILLAIFGLAAVAELFGEMFVFLKYCCAAYLMWLGISMFMSTPNLGNTQRKSVNAGSDVLAGFLFTLSNPKAIAFYVALFPAFINFDSLTYFDISGIVMCAILSFGSVNLIYSFLASNANKVAGKPSYMNPLRRIAGIVLTLSGLAIATGE